MERKPRTIPGTPRDPARGNQYRSSRRPLPPPRPASCCLGARRATGNACNWAGPAKGGQVTQQLALRASPSAARAAWLALGGRQGRPWPSGTRLAGGRGLLRQRQIQRGQVVTLLEQDAGGCPPPPQGPSVTVSSATNARAHSTVSAKCRARAGTDPHGAGAQLLHKAATWSASLARRLGHQGAHD